MKTVAAIFNCVHPLIFAHDDPAFPYSMMGTGFLVRYGSRLFVVTALHCFRNHQVKAEQVRIKPHSSSKEVIRFDRQYSGRSLFPDDPDREDILILHANIEHTLQDVLHELAPFPFDNAVCGVLGSPGLQYRVCGYPTSSCEVDYDTLRITGRVAFLSLQYNGLDTGMTHVHCLSYPTDESTDPNGLSGSPVFGITSLDSKRSLMQFVGLVIRGGNGNLYAIDGRLVSDAIYDAARREDEQDESTAGRVRPRK